jgi:hypothetical protein|nr:MAG TPA: tail assembly chaperone protein [Siphoviridae sp. ctTYz13]
MRKIIIKGKEYKIKQTLRSLFIFEQITNRPFKIETLLDNYIYFYSVILANNKDNVIDWDEFIDAVDENPSLLNEFTKMNEEQNKFDELFTDSNEKGEKKN